MNAPRSRARTAPCVLAICVALLGVGSAQAQKQERTLLERIQQPDLGTTATGFEKTFTPTTSGTNKEATVRLFGLRDPANLKAGGGSYRAATFQSGRGKFRADGYQTKASPLVDQRADGRDRAFATKTMAVREDRAAGKSAQTEDYIRANQQAIINGKRQDSIDELRRQKNLSIDEVRELLNRK